MKKKAIAARLEKTKKKLVKTKTKLSKVTSELEAVKKKAAPAPKKALAGKAIKATATNKRPASKPRKIALTELLPDSLDVPVDAVTEASPDGSAASASKSPG